MPPPQGDQICKVGSRHSFLQGLCPLMHSFWQNMVPCGHLHSSCLLIHSFVLGQYFVSIGQLEHLNIWQLKHLNVKFQSNATNFGYLGDKHLFLHGSVIFIHFDDSLQNILSSGHIPLQGS